MSTNAAIPLSYQPPQITPYPQAMGQMMSMAEAAQRLQMGPQQLQSAQLQNQSRQLENQQHQMELDSTQKLNDAIKNNMTVGTDGSYAIDQAGVAKSLAGSGWGSKVPGFMAGQLEIQAKRAQVMKDQLANEETLWGQGASILQGVKTAATQTDPQGTPISTPEQIEAAYQRARPAVQGVMQKLGYDPSTVPANYDADFVNQGIAHGTKSADLARQAKDAADLALQQATGKRAAQLFPSQLSEAQNKADQEARSNWSAQLANAKTADQYQSILNAAPHGIATQAESLVPVAQFDPAKSPQVLRQWGLSSEQATTANQRAANAAQTASHEKEMERLMAIARDQGQQRIDRSLDRTEADRVKNQAGLIWAGTLKYLQDNGGDTSKAEQVAILNATNPQYFPTEENPGGVVREIQKLAREKALTDKSESGVTSGAAAGLNIGTGATPNPGGSAPQRQTPPPPATAPRSTAATPATPAAPPPAQKWNVKGVFYSKGDPIHIGGKTYIFHGLDANGKIQAVPAE